MKRKLLWLLAFVYTAACGLFTWAALTSDSIGWTRFYTGAAIITAIWALLAWRRLRQARDDDAVAKQRKACETLETLLRDVKLPDTGRGPAEGQATPTCAKTQTEPRPKVTRHNDDCQRRRAAGSIDEEERWR